MLELLLTTRTQPKSWVAREIRGCCGFEARWGNLCPPSRIILCTPMGTLPHVELWSFASCSASVTDSTLFPEWIPASSALLRVIQNDLSCLIFLLLGCFGLPSPGVPHWACPEPPCPPAFLLALPSFSEHLPPTAAPGEVLPDLQGSQHVSSFPKIFLSLMEHHLVGSSPLVLILLLGRVDLDFFPGLGVCYQFTM